MTSFKKIAFELLLIIAYEKPNASDVLTLNDLNDATQPIKIEW